MTPSFEQEVENFKENPGLEQEYISGLRTNCLLRVEGLYAFCGRENEERPLIGVLETLEELSQIRERGRASSWFYETGLSDKGAYEISQGINYMPFAMSLSSDGKVYIGIEIVPEEAELYLGGLYNKLRSEGSQTTIIEKAEEWDVENGQYQLRNNFLKVLPKFLRDATTEPSLIIACDITMTNFGQAYLKGK
ncbi:MAG: hypothetical protein XD87_0447 [candidate division WS6 bacterium 36_33]|uniref:Uncharacterized protein n=1 Tax=candidate division WS6 bacterium 36_33 TaxID=1641388 RepID=A0A101GYN3_9BACT|nr:MAG: hypothetical protein XD87_0447 [candidate division WS6 bacterium 36_33]